MHLLEFRSILVFPFSIFLCNVQKFTKIGGWKHSFWLHTANNTHIGFWHWDFCQRSDHRWFASGLIRTEGQTERTQSERSLHDRLRESHYWMNKGLDSPSVLLLSAVLVNHEWSCAGCFNTRGGATWTQRHTVRAHSVFFNKNDYFWHFYLPSLFFIRLLD